MSDAPLPPRKTNALAVTSLVFGVLSYLCFWGIGGLLGLALGAMAKSEIRRSASSQSGAKLATAGMLLGSVNLALTIVALGALIAYAARPATPSPRSPVVHRSPVAHHGPTSPSPHTPHLPSPTASARGMDLLGAPTPGNATRNSGVLEANIGEVTLADIGPGVASLLDELERQQREARQHHERVLLWLVVPDCAPCDGVAVALADRRMQQALGDVRLVRLNVRDFAAELQHLDVPIEKIPGFALLGQNSRPIDYVHGGEWDADVPENIAPVLGSFVRGEYTERRQPWHGGRREDETAL